MFATELFGTQKNCKNSPDKSKKWMKHKPLTHFMKMHAHVRKCMKCSYVGNFRGRGTGIELKMKGKSKSVSFRNQ